MTTENDKWMQGDGRPEQTQGGGSRVGAPEVAKNGRDCDAVSITTEETKNGGTKTVEERTDGSTCTTVVHPPRPLKAPGQIKGAYESDGLDLERFMENAREGLQAMTAVKLSKTSGVGKDRVVEEYIEYVPDWTMRLKWQEQITNVVEGMPVKRQEIISKKVTTEEDLLKQASESPAFCKSLMKMLEKIHEQHLSNKGGVKNVTPDPDES